MKYVFHLCDLSLLNYTLKQNYESVNMIGEMKRGGGSFS